MSRTLESEKFQRAFDAYFWKWWMVIGILYFIAFSLYTILIFNRVSDSEFPAILVIIWNHSCLNGQNDV